MEAHHTQQPEPLSPPPPQGRVLEVRSTGRPNYVTHDITADFTLAASKLATGQLIQDDFFTLFDAVSALEIMDPKMDTGYVAPGDTFDCAFDVRQPVTVPEVIWLLDELLCQEMEWHGGHPLSTTVFSSAYIDKLLSDQHQTPPSSLGSYRYDQQNLSGNTFPDTVLHKVIAAYCRGLIKCCDIVHTVITSQYYFEEEDFVSHKFNRSLLSEVSYGDIALDLEDTLKAVETDNETFENPGEKEAILSRLNFRFSFLQGLSRNVVEAFKGFKADITKCQNQIVIIQESHHLAEPLEESFSTKFQRKLASSVPPRPIVKTDFERSMKELTKLCKDVVDIFQGFKFHGSQNLLTFVQTFLSRHPQPSVFVKCLLQAIIFDGPKMLRDKAITEMIKDDLKETCTPVDLYVYPLPGNGILSEAELVSSQEKIEEELENFAIRASECYVEVFKFLFNNRSRTRRVLSNSLISWDILQAEAEDIDLRMRLLTNEQPLVEASVSNEALYMFPYSSWCYFHKLRHMEWIVQLGFELDIYDPSELSGMYFYLQYISETRLHHAERMRGFATRQTRMYISDPTFERTSKRAKIKSDVERTLAFQDFEILHSTAVREFGLALSILYCVLQHRLKVMASAERPYGSDALRHELRTKPFMGIGSPELISYSDFTMMVTHEGDTTSEILRLALEEISKAVERFIAIQGMTALQTHSELCPQEWKTKIKSVLRAALATKIQITKVVKSYEEIQSDEGWKGVVDLKSEYHSWWIVPTVTLSR